MKYPRLTHWLWVGLAVLLGRIAGEAADGYPPPAREILRRAIAARGGDAALTKIHSLRAKGTVHFYNFECPLEVSALRSNRFRLATDLTALPWDSSAYVPPRYYDHGFDGTSAWELLPGQPPQRLEGIFAEERREQAGFFAWCAKPQDYRSLTNRGETEFRGRRCYELHLVRGAGAPETQFYDATNHLLVGLLRSSVFGPGLEQFAFENYRESGGFQFPTRIRYTAENEAEFRSVEEFSAIEVNTAKESAFEMPQARRRPADSPAAAGPEVTEAELRRLLRDWVEADKLAEAIVVGLVDEHGRRVVACGKLNGKEVNGDTAFPLASISKVSWRSCCGPWRAGLKQEETEETEEMPLFALFLLFRHNTAGRSP
jgi:hypothetical protein